MKRGRFITFEGGEGAGKSTQARMLAEALDEMGKKVLLTREPGGTPGAEAIRALLLDTDREWSPRAEALLFAAARSDHVTNAIEPALARGEWVICDRFIDSSRAYQGGEDDLDDDDVMRLHRIGSGGLLPDLTLLLRVEADIANRRLALRDGGSADRIGGRSAHYHRKVGQHFEAMAADEPHRIVRISGHNDANSAGQSARIVHGYVMEAIRPLLDETA